MSIKAIICGARRVPDGVNVGRALDDFERAQDAVLGHVVVGSARGVDGSACAWALERERVVTIVPARWTEHGRAAGPIRNAAMAELHRPHLVLAFPGGTGTASMVDIARRKGIPLFRWEAGVWIAPAAALPGAALISPG